MIDSVESFINYSINNACRNYRYRSGIYQRNTWFNKYIFVNLQQNSIEVPAFLKYQALFAYQQKFNSICLPLCSSVALDHKRYIRTILNTFSRELIGGVQTANGDIYYGYPGVIFNKDLEPLMMMTLKIDISKPTYDIERAICRVSPLVFKDSKKIVEKTIIRKVIPYCLNNKAVDPQIYYLLGDEIVRTNITRDYLNRNIQVIIDDCSDFVYEVTAPNGNFSQDKATEFIRSEENEIMNNFISD